MGDVVQHIPQVLSLGLFYSWFVGIWYLSN